MEQKQPLILHPKDEEGWDWRVISIMTAVFSAHNMDALALAVIIAVIIGILWAAWNMFNYIYRVYRIRAFNGTRTGYVLIGGGIVCLVIFLLSMAAYRYGSSTREVAWNEFAFSFLCFVLLVVGVDMHQERVSGPVPVTGSQVANVLTWKKP